MVRSTIDEMAVYRARAVRVRRNRKNGRRKRDARDSFFAIGWVLEFIALLALGILLLNACARRFI